VREIEIEIEAGSTTIESTIAMDKSSVSKCKVIRWSCCGDGNHRNALVECIRGLHGKEMKLNEESVDALRCLVSFCEGGAIS